MRTAKRFDRVDYVCPKCKVPGIIHAVWISLAEVRLEAGCRDCNTSAPCSIDLLKVDEWLAED